MYLFDNCDDMLNYFYSTVQTLLNCYLPKIEVTKFTTDKLLVMPGFQELVKERQRASLKEDLARYHRLRNRVQHTAAKLRKKLFFCRSKTTPCMWSHQWWTKTKWFLKMPNSNPLASLECQGTLEHIDETINTFFLVFQLIWRGVVQKDCQACKLNREDTYSFILHARFMGNGHQALNSKPKAYW